MSQRSAMPGSLRTSPAPALFPPLALLWILVRLAPPGAGAVPAVESAIAAVRVALSPESGRYEVRGLPPPGEDLGLFRGARGRTARARLIASIEEGNERLARVAAQVAGRLEIFPDEGVTGLRIAGTLVPFYDQDAERLAQVRRNGSQRVGEALQEVSRIVDARLSEPPDGFALEESARRRDLARLLSDVEETLRQVEARNERSLAAFRGEMREVARAAAGPFQRRGRGRLLEILLAALLGVTLHGAVRGRPPAGGPWTAIAFAPVLAASAVLLAEGTFLLPVDPIAGTSPRFLPLAFGLGFAAPALLALAARGSAAGEPADAAERPAPDREVAREEPAVTPRPHAPEEEPLPRPPRGEPAARAVPSLAPEPAPTEREVAEERPARTSPPPRPFFSVPRRTPPAAGSLPFFRRRRGSAR